MFGWLLDALSDFASFVGTSFSSLLAWLLEMFYAIVERGLDLLGQLIAYVLGLIPTGFVDTLNTIPWASMRTYMDDINWFIPIYGLIAVVTTTLGLSGTIRLLRWIKSFVPTISG